MKIDMDALDPVSREVLERVARIVGPHSAAAQALTELDKRIKAGERVAAYQAGTAFYVGPAPKDRVTYG